MLQKFGGMIAHDFAILNSNCQFKKFVYRGDRKTFIKWCSHKFTEKNIQITTLILDLS